MAVVYLAEDLKHGRRVAVKVMLPEMAAAIGQDRFLREIETAARLTHPHILPLHDSGAADGHFYYVRPYIQGESLRARLDRERQVPSAQIGTPQYMAPEQASGGDVDGRTDLYSLAWVLYEMLAGDPPFIGPDPQSLIHQHLSAVPRPVSDRRQVPPGVDAALVRGLAKLPVDRFPTVTAFAEALADRRILLVLDNCEHVLGQAADLVDALLTSCPGLRIVATSREGLGVPGEQPVSVRSLPVPGAAVRDLSQVEATEAVRLFLDRAQVVAPGFRAAPHMTGPEQPRWMIRLASWRISFSPSHGATGLSAVRRKAWAWPPPPGGSGKGPR